MSVEVITTISPTTDDPILARNGISPQELEQLPDIATQAFDSWRTTKLQARQDIVKKALKILDERKEELATELTVQMGRPIAYTAKEVATAVKRAEYLVGISDEYLKDTPGQAEKGFKRFIRKVPVGPVLIIFAWNVGFATRRGLNTGTDKDLLVSISHSRQCSHTCSLVRQLGHPQAISPNPYRRRAGGQGLYRGGLAQRCDPVLPFWLA